MNFFNNGFPNGFPRPQQNMRIDPVRFQQAALQLDKEKLAQLVQQARQQGIPEAQIEAGLNYILSLR